MKKNNSSSKISLARKTGFRLPNTRILIVCEGKETEPNYFNGIKRVHRLPGIKIVTSNKKTPMRILDHAFELFNKGNRHHPDFEEKAFDEVYIVFDRDDVANYKNAIDKACSIDKSTQMINDKKKHARFKAIPSSPCFELWFLLHYVRVSSYLSCADAEKKLKRHCPDYEKNITNMYERTMEGGQKACRYAKKLVAEHTSHAEPELYTKVHVLVARLLRLAHPT